MSRVFAIMITAPGVHTARGVAVGDKLAAARRAYPHLHCGTGGTGEFGYFPFCGGKIASNRWIWFGRNPIRSITIASRELAR